MRRLQCIPWEGSTGLRWAELLAALHASGRAMPIKDSLIAATALSHDLTIATLNRRDFDAAGVTVAIPSYTLCPAASVMEIGDEIQACLAALWKKTRKHPTVVGHSAGGHLTVEMMARSWGGFPGVPADLVRSGYAISGVFDLSPLIGTSLNQALGLSKGTARAASPLFRPPSPKGRHLVAAVGGDESGEFLRQSREIAEGWSKVGIDATCEVIAGTNHFTVVEELIRQDSLMLRQIVAMAHAAEAD